MNEPTPPTPNPEQSPQPGSDEPTVTSSPATDFMDDLARLDAQNDGADMTIGDEDDDEVSDGS